MADITATRSTAAAAAAVPARSITRRVKRRAGVSSGPTWLPLAASLALGLFSPFLSFLPPESFILEYLGRFSKQRLFNEQQFRNLKKTIYISIRHETRFTLLVVLSDETASVRLAVKKKSR
ncbi:hypothetical protein ALC57_15831 [Trachymyrmex cornetzi]|uniref:Uncharacterized protein n=1 Tax=Trachymyrmex cornetzi TaxID=471704 RepID=A0A151IW07_9HYME|nr:hypothetical protein ALC57_15831 [Trachymyrmex cornetzi]